MKCGERLLWLTSVLFCILIESTHEATGARKKRSVKWQTENGRRVLAEDLSSRDDFKYQLLKPFMIERQPGTLGHETARQHILEHFRRLEWDIKEDIFTQDTVVGPKTFKNIVVTYNPLASERLVLACHYDSKVMPFKFIGATDSAVPCAILMDLANTLDCLLSKEPSKDSAKNLTVQLLFLDGEEAFKEWNDHDSIYGAKHLAKKWRQEQDPVNPQYKYIDTVTDFVLLDLIGTIDTTFKDIVPETSGLFASLNKIEKALSKKDLLKIPSGGNEYKPMFSSVHSYRAGIQDDHIPFQKENVDILHLISYPFPEVWHRKTDDENHLNFDLIDNFNRIFRVFVASYLQYSGLSASGCRKIPKFHALRHDDTLRQDNNGWRQNDDYLDGVYN